MTALAIIRPDPLWHETPAVQAQIARMFTLTRISAQWMHSSPERADGVGSLSKQWVRSIGLVHTDTVADWVAEPEWSECGAIYRALEKVRAEHIDAMLRFEGLNPRWFDVDDMQSCDRYVELERDTPTLFDAIEQYARENVG